MRSIRHFRNLDDRVRRELFSVLPEPVPMDAPAPSIGESLGAVVYLPAVRADLPGDLQRLRSGGAEAVVIDLEDSVPTEERAALLTHVDAALRALDSRRCPPAIFLRPAHAEALAAFDVMSPVGAALITGVVMPKVSRANFAGFIGALRTLEGRWRRRLLAMPVLEGPAIAHARSRVDELEALRGDIVGSSASVAAVRIGAADLGGAFGIRRDGRHTIYEIAAIAAAIGDIVSTFGRVAHGAVPIAGPVWEHFGAGVDVGPAPAADVLVEEIRLDRANGLIGKTVIHPSHIGIVHALHVVDEDEYADALDIVAAGPGGVSRGRRVGRMNEASPHRGWAERTLRRARTFGVFGVGVSYADVAAAVGAAR